MSIDARLNELGITLPQAAAPDKAVGNGATGTCRATATANTPLPLSCDAARCTSSKHVAVSQFSSASFCSSVTPTPLPMRLCATTSYGAAHRMPVRVIASSRTMGSSSPLKRIALPSRQYCSK